MQSFKFITVIWEGWCVCGAGATNTQSNACTREHSREHKEKFEYANKSRWIDGEQHRPSTFDVFSPPIFFLNQFAWQNMLNFVAFSGSKANQTNECDPRAFSRWFAFRPFVYELRNILCGKLSGNILRFGFYSFFHCLFGFTWPSSFMCTHRQRCRIPKLWVHGRARYRVRYVLLGKYLCMWINGLFRLNQYFRINEIKTKKINWSRWSMAFTSQLVCVCELVCFLLYVFVKVTGESKGRARLAGTEYQRLKQQQR